MFTVQVYRLYQQLQYQPFYNQPKYAKQQYIYFLKSVLAFCTLKQKESDKQCKV